LFSKDFQESASTQTYTLPCRQCWPVLNLRTAERLIAGSPVLGQEFVFYSEFWLCFVVISVYGCISQGLGTTEFTNFDWLKSILKAV